eukprot:4569946-Alexandrium_andersonii.AAC.1
MSASLVGSEMCIRDRDNKPWGAGGASKAIYEYYGIDRGFPRGLKEESVSYTHLTLPTICSV